MDLRDGIPFWPSRDGRQFEFPALAGDVSCEVLVVGAGITGALVALELAYRGMDVVVVDRRDTGTGSTAASTALLQYEIDLPLTELAKKHSPEVAVRAYRQCLRGISLVAAAEKRVAVACGFQQSPSIQVIVRKRDVPAMQRELDARSAAGFDVRWLCREELRNAWGLNGVAGILSAAGGSVDPFRLCQAALRKVVARGHRVFDRTEVTDWQFTRQRVTAHTNRGAVVHAKHCVIASGYEVKPLLPNLKISMYSTFALASEPIADLRQRYRRGVLFWEYARPYLYGRTTDDNRMLIGGADEHYRDPVRRKRALPAKIRHLVRAAARRLPGPALEVAYGWSGTFAETPDGLAYIGGHSSFPRCQFALGFGGNGITYSALAAKYIAAAWQGDGEEPDRAIFSLQRSGMHT